MKQGSFYLASVLLITCAFNVTCFAANHAQEPEPKKETTVKCSHYIAPKSKVLSERAGKKIMKAYEHYMDESIDEAIRIQETIEQLKAVNAQNPFDQASADRFLGQILYQQEESSDEAINTLALAVNNHVLNDKEHADTLALLGNLSFREEAFKAGIDWHKKWLAFTCDHDPALYTQLATAYTQLGDYKKVIEMADKAIYYKQQAGARDSSIKLSEKELAANKKPYELKINALYERKEFQLAVKVAETLITQFPDDQQWWPRLGFLYMTVEEFDKALETFYLANKLGYLSKANEYKALVQLYASNNVPYTSAKLHKQYIEAGIFESSAQEWASLANTLQLAREYTQAAHYYGLAAKQMDDPEYYRKQGVLLMTAQKYSEAVTALNLSLDKGIDEPLKVHFSLMEAHFFAGDYERAMIHAEKAKESYMLLRNVEAWIPYIQQKISQQKGNHLRASL